MPVGIDRSNIDRAVAHRVEQLAHGTKITDDARIQRRAVRRSITQEVMTKRVKGRMRVVRRPTQSPAKCVRKCVEATVRLDDEVRAVQRLLLRPGCRGNRRGDWRYCEVAH